MIKVAILDDHQTVIDGYLFRLQGTGDIQVCATLHFGEELQPALAREAVDVLILDVSAHRQPNP